jgi:SPP1 family predicted phage head-tail adaptor
MTSDYYKTLSKRVVTQVADGAGGYTETTADTNIQGYITKLSGQEVLKSQQLKLNATARLYTPEILSVKDRVVDPTGYFSIAGTQFEIVFPNQDIHTTERSYDLKEVL